MIIYTGCVQTYLTPNKWREREKGREAEGKVSREAGGLGGRQRK